MLGKNLLLALAGKGATFTFELTHTDIHAQPCSVLNYQGEPEDLPLSAGTYVMPQISSFLRSVDFYIPQATNLSQIGPREYIPNEKEEDSYVQATPRSGGGGVN